MLFSPCKTAGMSICFDVLGQFTETGPNALLTNGRTTANDDVRRGHLRYDQMKDYSFSEHEPVIGVKDAEVRDLAQRAIQTLAIQGRAQSRAMTRRLDLFCDAYTSEDHELHHEALLRLRQDGVSTADIIDHVIPAAARLLGDRWCSNRLSFADVTIGAARLQETVRALIRKEIDIGPVDSLPAILMVNPRTETHTLATLVAGDQFRRAGYRVETILDAHPAQMAQLLRKRRFVMIGITSSGRRTLASTRELVDVIRAVLTRVTPIVIGGSVLDTDIDVIRATGADHTARNVQTALRKCRLPIAES